MAENLKDPAQQDEELEIIDLVDENGQEHSFDVLDELEYHGTRYLAVVPYAQTEEELLNEELELHLMKVGEDEEGAFYDIVDDDDPELEEVYQVFRARLIELYDFED